MALNYQSTKPKSFNGGPAFIVWIAVSLFGSEIVAWAASSDQVAASQCKVHLDLIYDAAQIYRIEHGVWPERLSDLSVRYLAPEVLICPECERQRLFGVKNGNLVNTADSDSRTVYKWELNTKQKCPGREDKTWQDLKFRQRETPVGEAVPIVRCDQHEIDGKPAHLNLTFGGDIYSSGSSWEENFRGVLAMPYLLAPKQVFGDARKITERVPGRPQGATDKQIDLRLAATAMPGDPWQDGRSEDTMADLLKQRDERGLFRSRGVAFDVRALVQLDGRRKRKDEIGRELLYYPIEPRIISVGNAGRKLAMLGGVIFPARNGAEVGGLRIKFANGHVQRMPWRYGIEVRDGWYDQETGLENETLAWIGGDSIYEPRDFPKRPGRLKVYHMTVDLEYPSSAVTSLEFYSSASNSDPEKQYPSGPFLLAVTME